LNTSSQKDWKFELEQVFRSDAAEILAARAKAITIHHGRDTRAAGDEVEIASRKMLARKLPALYYVGHGHIVDQELHESPQLDVIIANNTGSPILFRAENGTEYYPYEGVYAFGEVKSSYDKSKHYIHAFSETLKKIRTQLQRKPFWATPPQRPNYDAILNPFIKPFGNPLFSFMFFADAGDFKIEQIRELYQKQPAAELPNIICILNKGVIVSTLSHIRKNRQQTWEPVEPGHPQAINLIPENNDDYQKYFNVQSHWNLIEHGDNEMSLAANLARFYYPLIEHLKRCQLTLPDLTEYMNRMFDKTTTTFIA
jgi:hypothetical protein